MKKATLRWLSSFLFIVVVGLSCSKSDLTTSTDNALSKPKPAVKFTDQLSNQVLIDWNQAALEAEGGVLYQNPLFSSRADVMMHLAMHDALNAIIPVYEQYAYHGRMKGADPVVAAAQAAYTVLLSIYPAAKPALDNLLNTYHSKSPDDAAKQKAIQAGLEAGMAIVNQRQNDGSSQNPIGPMAVSTIPGVYNTVPPFNFVFAEFWKTMEPFSLKSPDQFRAGPPPDLTSMQYTKDFNEVKSVGGLNSTTRTEDQSFYAQFWYEFVEIGWNRIARTVVTSQNIGLWSSARLFALLNMAIADSYIAGWDSKYYYNFWRPYTAIHAAALDGNSRTEPDATWESFLLTPPIPDYPSTHSTGGSAAATVLTLLTNGNTAFTMTSSTSVPVGASRSFQSFKQAADENADSRVIAGIHFRTATNVGLAMGIDIGRWTVKNHLQPLKGGAE